MNVTPQKNSHASASIDHSFLHAVSLDEGNLYHWRGSKKRIQIWIDKNAAKLANIKIVIDNFQSQSQSQSQQMVNTHRSELEGDVAKLFEEFMAITTTLDNGESETTV